MGRSSRRDKGVLVGAPVQAFTEVGARFGAMSACIGAAAMFVWEGLVAVLLMTGPMVALHLVPGLWLLRRSRRASGRQAPPASGTASAASITASSTAWSTPASASRCWRSSRPWTTRGD